MGFGAAAFGAGGFAAWAAGKRRKKQDKTAPWKEKVKKGAASYEPAVRGGDELPERIQKMPQPEKESGPREEIFGETVALSAGCVSGPASLVSREPENWQRSIWTGVHGCRQDAGSRGRGDTGSHGQPCTRQDQRKRRGILSGGPEFQKRDFRERDHAAKRGGIPGFRMKMKWTLPRPDMFS